MSQDFVEWREAISEREKETIFNCFEFFLFLHELFSFSVCHTATWRGFGFTFNLTFSLAKGGSTCPGNEK